MNIKIILFDIDGVIVRPPHYFGKVLEDKGYNNAEVVLNDFFIHENTDCTEGRADISKKILPYLEKIGWSESIEKFLDEQFEFESQFLDTNILSLVKKLQEKDIECYLASAQEAVRAKYFLETVGFRDIFDGDYISCDVGHRKDKPEYWGNILPDLQKKHRGLNLSEILFIDDGKKNIKVARTFGIQTLFFINTEQFEKDLGTLGIYTL